MEKKINILIASAGRRTRLLEYFKGRLNGIGKVVAADCSELAPAIYIADQHYIVPRIDHEDYIKSLIDICRKEEINAVLSLIDPELSLLAQNMDAFKELGITVIVSPYEICELWLDKYKSACFLKENGFKYAKTYRSLVELEKGIAAGEVQFPVFMKPQKGSASLNINKARNLEEAKLIFEAAEEMIAQEYLRGQELGVDVYVDFITKKVVSIFIKVKEAMRAGETDKARSIQSEPLFKLIEELVTKAGLVGPLDVDVFEVNGNYYISEINPRFGGGYPLAYECGVDFIQYIINNLQGNKNDTQIGNYEENIYMLKHDTVMIKKFK